MCYFYLMPIVKKNNRNSMENAFLVFCFVLFSLYLFSTRGEKYVIQSESSWIRHSFCSSVSLSVWIHFLRSVFNNSSTIRFEATQIVFLFISLKFSFILFIDEYLLFTFFFNRSCHYLFLVLLHNGWNANWIYWNYWK